MKSGRSGGRKLQPLGEAAVWIGIAAIAWIYSYEFAGGGGEAMLFRWGAEAWPRAVIIGLTLCAICQCVVELRRATGRGNAEDDDGKSKARYDFQAITGIVATFMLPLLYAFLLPRTGYYATTPFFIAAIMYTFGVRRPLHLIGTNILIYGIILLVFSKLLFVAMPTGYWPGFYDFSNWFIGLLE